MRTVSWFYGVSIRMFFFDHPPPHFHAYYESQIAVIEIETGAVIEIETGAVITGRLPSSVARLVERWRVRYISEIREAWTRVERGDVAGPGRIPGLDKA